MTIAIIQVTQVIKSIINATKARGWGDDEPFSLSSQLQYHHKF
jgi:hypothetical protein